MGLSRCVAQACNVIRPRLSPAQPARCMSRTTFSGWRIPDFADARQPRVIPPPSRCCKTSNPSCFAARGGIPVSTAMQRYGADARSVGHRWYAVNLTSSTSGWSILQVQPLSGRRAPSKASAASRRDWAANAASPVSQGNRQFTHHPQKSAAGRPICKNGSKGVAPCRYDAVKVKSGYDHSSSHPRSGGRSTAPQQLAEQTAGHRQQHFWDVVSRTAISPNCAAPVSLVVHPRHRVTLR
jgi:hypothetical protein